jgi:hypothetical protein
MMSRHPFRVREYTKGTGGACGAIFLTQYFKDLLFEKVGEENRAILTPKRLAEAVHNFERTVKFTLNPYDKSSHTETSIEIPLPGAPDIPAIKLEDGYITLSRYKGF